MPNVSWSWPSGTGKQSTDGTRTYYKSAVRQDEDTNETRAFHVGDSVITVDGGGHTMYAHLIDLFDNHPNAVPGTKSSPTRMRCTLRWFYDAADLTFKLPADNLAFSDHIETPGSNPVYVLSGIVWLFQTPAEAESFRNSPFQRYDKAMDEVRIVRRFINIVQQVPYAGRALRTNELIQLLVAPTDKKCFNKKPSKTPTPRKSNTTTTEAKPTRRKRKQQISPESTPSIHDASDPDDHEQSAPRKRRRATQELQDLHVESEELAAESMALLSDRTTSSSSDGISTARKARYQRRTANRSPTSTPDASDSESDDRIGRRRVRRRVIVSDDEDMDSESLGESDGDEYQPANSSDEDGDHAQRAPYADGSDNEITAVPETCQRTLTATQEGTRRAQRTSPSLQDDVTETASPPLLATQGGRWTPAESDRPPKRLRRMAPPSVSKHPVGYTTVAGPGCSTRGTPLDGSTLDLSRPIPLQTACARKDVPETGRAVKQEAGPVAGTMRVDRRVGVKAEAEVVPELTIVYAKMGRGSRKGANPSNRKHEAAEVRVTEEVHVAEEVRATENGSDGNAADEDADVNMEGDEQASVAENGMESEEEMRPWMDRLADQYAMLIPSEQSWLQRNLSTYYDAVVKDVVREGDGDDALSDKGIDDIHRRLFAEGVLQPVDREAPSDEGVPLADAVANGVAEV